ncbi:MAG TPA: arylamine N-acetyltransferase [Marmoricola sp.]|nr:arylamine N-acetyltransferase [Marmoricola sp.]
MSEDPWHVERLDLDAYLALVGVDRASPSLEGMGDLHEAHVRTFAFENIDVLLDAHPGVTLEVVQRKFLAGGRGGYCFEHATLFAAVLQRLGYDVRRQLGRVGDPTRAGRTHCVVVVTLEGQRWLCDPGFGMSLLRPMPMTHGAEVDDQGWRYRLRRVGDEHAPMWEMYRLREAGWELMHTTDELPVHPIDIEMGHHFTSTWPPSHFRSGLILTRHLADRHVTVTHETVTVRRPTEPTEHRALEPGELATLVPELGITLPAEDLARLVARF